MGLREGMVLSLPPHFTKDPYEGAFMATKTSNPLLPIEQKSLTRAQAADLLRGVAEMIELYPSDNLIVTLNVETASITPPKRPPSRKKTASEA